MDCRAVLHSALDHRPASVPDGFHSCRLCSSGMTVLEARHGLSNCNRQVCNLQSAIKVASDFLSPCNLAATTTIFEQLRLDRIHSGKDDVLRLHTTLWDALSNQTRYILSCKGTILSCTYVPPSFNNLGLSEVHTLIF